MLHEIGVELQAELQAKGCPFKVVDGPEATTTVTFGRERIVIQYDEDGGDTFSGPLSQRPNQKQFFVRRFAAKLTIYAQAPAVGALEFEHRRRAEHVLDLVLVAIDKVARRRENMWQPTGGKFVQPPDLAKSETIGGAVYELRFAFDRGVADRTWPGADLPEVTVGTDVTIVNSPPDVSGP